MSGKPVLHSLFVDKEGNWENDSELICGAAMDACFPRYTFELRFKPASILDLKQIIAKNRMVFVETDSQLTSLAALKVCQTVEALMEEEVLAKICSQMPGKEDTYAAHDMVVSEVASEKKLVTSMISLTRSTSYFRLFFNHNLRKSSKVVYELIPTIQCTLAVRSNLMRVNQPESRLSLCTHLRNAYRKLIDLLDEFRLCNVTKLVESYCVPFENDDEYTIPEYLTNIAGESKLIQCNANLGEELKLCEEVIIAFEEMFFLEEVNLQSTELSKKMELEEMCAFTRDNVQNLIQRLIQATRLDFLLESCTRFDASYKQYLANQEKLNLYMEQTLDRLLKQAKDARRNIVFNMIEKVNPLLDNNNLADSQTPAEASSPLGKNIPSDSETPKEIKGYIYINSDLRDLFVQNISETWNGKTLIVVIGVLAPGLRDFFETLIKVLDKNKENTLIVIGTEFPRLVQVDHIRIKDSAIGYQELDLESQQWLKQSALRFYGSRADYFSLFRHSLSPPDAALAALLTWKLQDNIHVIEWLGSEIKRRIPLYRIEYRFLNANQRNFITGLLARRYKLHFAVYKKAMNGIGMLIDQGCDVNGIDDGGRTALHLAAMHGSDAFQLIRILLAFQACRHIQDRILAWTPAQYADKTLDLDEKISWKILSSLLFGYKQKSPEVNLIHCASAGLSKALEYRMEKNAKLDDQDQNGSTAIHLAIAKGNLRCFKMLLEKGAKCDLPNKAGQRPLFVAAHYGEFDMVKILVEKGHSLSDNDNKAWQTTMAALHVAARFGRLHIVKLLAEHGVDLNLRDGRGFTALHHAAEYGHELVARYLVYRGAQVDVQDEEMETPLFKACRRAHMKVVRLLVGHRANLHARNVENDIPVVVAEESGHYYIAAFLGYAEKWLK